MFRLDIQFFFIKFSWLELLAYPADPDEKLYYQRSRISHIFHHNLTDEFF